MNKNTLNQNLFSIIIFYFLLTFTSCGSFEGVSYYSTDGIYNNERSIKKKTEFNNSNNQSSNYYENYFKNFSNNSQDQVNEVPNSLNENSDVYIIDNSPNIRMRFGYNNFDYWNSWGFNGFGFPYNNFSNNSFFSPYYNPFWNFGYQGMYFNNGWGNGYSLYGWNNYNPYNYVVSNRNQYGRKVAYNRGSVNQRSFGFNSRDFTNDRISPSKSFSNKNTRTNIGRKIKGAYNNFSSQNKSNTRYNSNNRSNFKQNNFQSNNRSYRSSRPSTSSNRSKRGRNN